MVIIIVSSAIISPMWYIIVMYTKKCQHALKTNTCEYWKLLFYLSIIFPV